MKAAGSDDDGRPQTCHKGASDRLNRPGLVRVGQPDRCLEDRRLDLLHPGLLFQRLGKHGVRQVSIARAART